MSLEYSGIRFGIEEALKQVKKLYNSDDTPYLCAYIDISAANKAEILQQIIEIVGKRSFTISQSLVEIENQLNPNYTLN